MMLRQDMGLFLQKAIFESWRMGYILQMADRQMYFGKVIIIIQSVLGGTITPEEILSRIPSDADAVYIKPEENKAYWVKGSKSGSVELW